MEYELTSPYWRQLDIYNPEVDRNPVVSIIGCGGIGSFTAFALAKLGIKNLMLYDDDRVETHNFPNQIFRQASLTQLKTDALAYICREFSQTVNVVSSPFRITSTVTPTIQQGICIMAVDSMTARKEIWETIKYLGFELVIDGRLGGEMFKIYCIDPNDPQDCTAYESTLHSDKESVDLPCTAQGIIDVGFAIASRITRIIRLYLKDNKKQFLEVYDQANSQILTLDRTSGL